MSCRQKGVVVSLLHVEPHAVHRLELQDVGLFAADDCSEVPCPQVLKRRGTDGRGGTEVSAGKNKEEAARIKSPPHSTESDRWKKQRWWKMYLRGVRLTFIVVNIFRFA